MFGSQLSRVKPAGMPAMAASAAVAGRCGPGGGGWWNFDSAAGDFAGFGLVRVDLAGCGLLGAALAGRVHSLGCESDGFAGRDGVA